MAISHPCSLPSTSKPVSELCSLNTDSVRNQGTETIHHKGTWGLFVNNRALNLEKAMAPHSTTLTWKIPWTEEPGRLQSMESLRVGHDWATSLSLFTCMHWRRKWQPTPVFWSLGGYSPMGSQRVRHDWVTSLSLSLYGPNISGSYAILLFIVPDLASITSHIHNWVLFLLWLHPFILFGVISPLISSSILGTYWPEEFIFQCSIFLPFHTVHGVLKARILKWFAIPFSSGPHSVRSLHHDPPVLGMA